ncbi:MAG: 16S rRNA (guanine(966)-N(2))-methyltransferase RsmD [Candidatus Muiribacteriota bacterium]
MRIISGKLKGRKIYSIDNVKTRPLTNHIQEALFNILGDVEDVSVLELYAGFGMFSWEALSRGAEHVTMVEKNPRLIPKLKATAEAFDLTENVNIICKDIFKGLNLNKKFDLIFADPPFGLNLCEHTLNLIKKLNCLKKKGLFIMRRHKREIIKADSSLLTQRRYGNNIIEFYRFKDENKTS